MNRYYIILTSIKTLKDYKTYIDAEDTKKLNNAINHNRYIISKIVKIKSL